MSPRDLPARPHLDHLRNEAKALHKAALAGDAHALARVRSAIGDRDPIRLTDAQRVIAREYGFANWARLRTHVQQLTDRQDPVAAFLAAVQSEDAGRASQVVLAHPEVARESLHVAAALGRYADVEHLLLQNPSLVHAKAGDPPATALLFLSFSPFHGESAERDASLLATARALLDAGADPNTKDGRYGVPALYGVTGMRSVIPLARLLLERGANPTDGESVFHAAERFHVEALELLLAAGADLNYVGDWGNTALYFLLRWHDLEREPDVAKGLAWLLAHGANPNIPSGKDRESALHVATRRGQSARVVRILLEHGADVRLRRADGASPWLLARRGGFDEIAAVLESAGAEAGELTPRDELLAACGRGDIELARRLAAAGLAGELGSEEAAVLPEAAADSRTGTALACLAAGFPVNATDALGATALHHAAIRGRIILVEALLEAGAEVEIRDPEHNATPLGWACFGADHIADPEGEYERCVRALLRAGAATHDNQRYVAHAGVRAALEEETSAQSS